MQLATQFTNRTARTLALALGLLSLAPTVVYSQDDLAQREIQRRAEKVRQAEELLDAGRKAYQEGDYETAVTNYNEAIGVLPGGFATADRRRALEAHRSEERRVGKECER